MRERCQKGRNGYFETRSGSFFVKLIKCIPNQYPTFVSSNIASSSMFLLSFWKYDYMLDLLFLSSMCFNSLTLFITCLFVLHYGEFFFQIYSPIY